MFSSDVAADNFPKGVCYAHPYTYTRIYMEPKEVSDAMLAFPGSVIEEGLLPAWEDIPEDFKDHYNPWCRDVQALFFKGSTKRPLRAKDGVSPEKMSRHISACLRSYQPKHEHKEAGVAWLLSQWTEVVEEEE